MMRVCKKYIYLTNDSDPGAESLACNALLSDLYTDFARIAVKDVMLRIDSRIQAHEDGVSNLTKEQLEDYKHDAALFVKMWGR